MSQTPQKSAYRVKNWSQYNAALVKRGSLTVCVDQEALDAWHYQGPPRWGAQFIYSDTAIQCLLTLRVVFHLPLRATQGLAHSIFQLMGLPLDVPHYSTLSRHAATTRIDLPKQGDGPLQLVIDSTGLKLYGEGEWKVRQHGYSKRRTWRKLHTWQWTLRATRSRRRWSPRPVSPTPRCSAICWIRSSGRSPKRPPTGRTTRPRSTTPWRRAGPRP